MITLWVLFSAIHKWRPTQYYPFLYTHAHTNTLTLWASKRGRIHHRHTYLELTKRSNNFPTVDPQYQAVALERTVGGHSLFAVHCLLPTNPTARPPRFLYYVKQLWDQIRSYCYKCLSKHRADIGFSLAPGILWSEKQVYLTRPWAKLRCYDEVWRRSQQGHRGCWFSFCPNTYMVNYRGVDGIILLRIPWVWGCIWLEKVLTKRSHNISLENSLLWAPFANFALTKKVEIGNENNSLNISSLF